MNTEVDPEQMNKTHWTSQTNEQYACSVFVCSLPTLVRVSGVGREEKAANVEWKVCEEAAREAWSFSRLWQR